MKLLTFKYTKADGSESDRNLVVSVEPTSFFAGTDISELTMEDQALYIAALNAAKEEYMGAIEALNVEFDVKFRYRQFDPSRMTNVVVENI